MARAPRAVVLLGGCAAIVLALGNGALSQQAPPPPEQNAYPSSAELLDIPVTKIFPGDVDLAPKIESPVEGDAGAITRGMKYFINFNCVGCHAENGGGGMGPALSNRNFIYGAKPANVYLTIAQGRPNGMPAWGKVLPESVIWDLVAYVKSISKEPTEQWGKTTSLEALKIEQVPAEYQVTPEPWNYTQPFSAGQKPSGG